MSGQLPAGETGRELTGPEAEAALSAALKGVMARGAKEGRKEEVLTPAPVLADIGVTRDRRGILLEFRWRRRIRLAPFRVRVSRPWAAALRNRLNGVLDQ